MMTGFQKAALEMRQTGVWKYQASLIAGDTVILLTAFRLGMEYWWWKVGLHDQAFLRTQLVSIAVCLLALMLFNLYDIRTNYGSRPSFTISQLFVAILAAGIGLSGLFYFLPDLKLPRGVLLIQTVLAVPLLFTWRAGFYRFRQTMATPNRVLIIGTGQAGQAAVELLKARGSEYHVVGHITDRPILPRREVEGYPILGRAEDLSALVGSHMVTTLVMTGVGSAQITAALLQCRMKGVIVRDLLTLSEQVAGKILLDYVRDSWFVYAPGFLILRVRMFQQMKRITDVICAAIGLAFAAPLLVLASVLIVMESRGPLFFQQKRVGQNEQIFTVLKLRTMRRQTDMRSPYTQENDSRVTPVGGILRFLRIDEIPQMWNVLKGDMSFIGPRAEWDILVSEYNEKIPYYPLRHVVKPGITGWAQVNYPYGSSVYDAQKKLEFDLYYIKNMSLALDVKILLKTVSVVLFGKGVR